ncbi:Lactobacillus shifted protein [Vanrija pseudolonga]|uniref:Lactobacillus shifted protein n=1 Tax=Vanrija pseudolonga TaxID=143232 RepID=A0AAF0YBA1_9TREE|nr:Lactobacillus shifted protein [Vanrija pseudolonga]
MSVLAARRAWRLPALAARQVRLASSSSSSSAPAFSPSDKAPRDAAPAQSPNVAGTWSRDQNPKAAAFDNSRFEQVDFAVQPDSLSAMGLVSEQPITFVHQRVIACDGGGGPLGHPKIFINLDKEGPRACGYCGARYEQEHHH